MANIIEAGALKIVKILIQNGFTAYYAGGCVRDKVLNIPFKDIDIATSARPDEIINLFRKTITVGAQFGVVVVVMNKIQYEVATFRKDGDYLDGRRPESVEFTDEKEDVLRRSITINGMLYDPVNEKLIDYVGGREDLEKGLIRAIGNPDKRINEDKLRMLRGIRFAARFDFEIETETWKAIKKYQYLITQVSYERIRDEILKILTEGNAYKGLVLLDLSGLLETILPEISELKKITLDQSNVSLFDITFNMAKELEKNVGKSLALATLFYYISVDDDKIKSKKISIKYPDNINTEYPVRMICDRLKLSNQEKNEIVDLLGQKNIIEKIDNLDIVSLKKFLRQDHLEKQLELYKINSKALNKDLEKYHCCIERKKEFEQLGIKELFPDKLIDGQKLKELGFQPGPDFKKILDDIENLQLSGEIQTKNDALNYIHLHYNQS